MLPRRAENLRTTAPSAGHIQPRLLILKLGADAGFAGAAGLGVDLAGGLDEAGLGDVGSGDGDFALAATVFGAVKRNR
ncbi:MAG: hypothetical protein OES09_06755 [Gammaproteobacteria bacterium]|nr:hypothetical protein [Gammaproteobacteria bacterium]